MDRQIHRQNQGRAVATVFYRGSDTCACLLKCESLITALSIFMERYSMFDTVKNIPHYP